MLQPLTSPRNLLTRFIISVVYVATVTCIGCAVREPAAWLLRGGCMMLLLCTYMRRAQSKAVNNID